MGALKDYQDWKVKNSSIGCRFARMIAMKPDRYGNTVAESSASASETSISNSVFRIVSNAISDPHAVALTVLLSKVASFDLFCGSMIELCTKSNWSLNTFSVISPNGTNFTAVSMSVQVPRSDGIEVPSEVLAFGPFDHYPETRRAPVVAIELYVGDPLLADPKTGTDKKKANLAHIDFSLLPDEAFKRNWDASVDGRLKSLGGVEDARAKAKVSFVLLADQASKYRLE